VSGGLSGASGLFPGAVGCSYLNTAAEGLTPGGLAGALARYAADKEVGYGGREDMLAAEARCRSAVARLLAVEEESVALVPSASRGINAIIATVAWLPGDVLVTTDLEFPSVDLACARLRQRGVEIRVLRCRAGSLDPELFAHALRGPVKLAIVSLVSFKTGGLTDLTNISAAARTHKVPLLLDATQALGAIPFDASLADAVVASSFKWLLGVHGVAILYVNQSTAGSLTPDYAGWRSVPDLFAPDRGDWVHYWPDARRFDEGMPAFPSIYGLEHGLAALGSFEPHDVADHIRALGSRLIGGLEALGWGRRILTPRAAASRAGIVSVADSSCEDRVSELRARGIIVWGRDGRLRASMHLYNGPGDVDRLLDALATSRREM
jgi:cysteine desulfurase / selenocysteine lyase